MCVIVRGSSVVLWKSVGGGLMLNIDRAAGYSLGQVGGIEGGLIDSGKVLHLAVA